MISCLRHVVFRMFRFGIDGLGVVSNAVVVVERYGQIGDGDVVWRR